MQYSRFRPPQSSLRGGMMIPLHDYFYRFPREYLQIPGRCRVRIYKRKNGTHMVVLTELNNNAGESISSACARIATDLVMRKGLNPKTTRWIQQEPPPEIAVNGNGAYVFHELRFTWDSQNTAGEPEWNGLEDAEVEALTGDSLKALIQVMGDKDPHVVDALAEKGTDYEPIETKRSA